MDRMATKIICHWLLPETKKMGLDPNQGGLAREFHLTKHFRIDAEVFSPTRISITRSGVKLGTRDSALDAFRFY